MECDRKEEPNANVKKVKKQKNCGLKRRITLNEWLIDQRENSNKNHDENT